MAQNPNPSQQPGTNRGIVNRKPIDQTPAMQPSNNEGLLEFRETYSIEGFKQKVGAQKIKVMRNPATDLLFFSCGPTTGAVSQRSTLTEIQTDPVISLVEPKDGGESFYLLHKNGGLESELEL